MKAGRKPDYDIDTYILDILREFSLLTPEYIRKQIKKKKLRTVGWETVKRHLETMKDDGRIGERLISKGDKRRIYVYYIKE